jgi:uncharacterized protein YcbX
LQTLTVTITSLNLYPVKSLRGIPVDEAELTPRGLRHDRRWMLIDDRDRFVTQRDLARLALVSQRLDEHGVRLSADGVHDFHVRFDDSDGERITTEVWGDACEVIDCGEDVSRWLDDALRHKHSLRLVRMAPGWERPQRHPEVMGAQTRSYFADGAPYLVANQASLDALNTELQSRGIPLVPMNRFRPNVVVAGLKPFAEHREALLENDRYALRLCYPCERCVVTTINQDTAERDPDRQPFRTLRDINPMPGRAPAPAFAQNSALERGTGVVIQVGDTLGCKVIAD